MSETAKDFEIERMVDSLETIVNASIVNPNRPLSTDDRLTIHKASLLLIRLKYALLREAATHGR